jgi:hypothetical protein
VKLITLQIAAGDYDGAMSYIAQLPEPDHAAALKDATRGVLNSLIGWPSVENLYLN